MSFHSNITFSVSPVGIASGLIYVPGMALIPHYFKRYRSRASAVPFCGGAAANIVSPFFIKAAREQYGVRGVFMIQSAIELNYCVVGLLLRPVSAYRWVADSFTKCFMCELEIKLLAYLPNARHLS